MDRNYFTFSPLFAGSQFSSYKILLTFLVYYVSGDNEKCVSFEIANAFFVKRTSGQEIKVKEQQKI